MNTAIASASSQGLTDDRMEDQSMPGKNCLSAQELTLHIERCVLNNRDSQKKIYSSFYGYAMFVCGSYTNSHEDMIEILNDGFLKIFKHLHHYKPAYADVVSSFKGWLRKIMVSTAIDHFRRYRKHQFITPMDDQTVQVRTNDEDAPGKISYKEIMKSVEELTPGYRTVFNLFIIKGLTHEEISGQLGISIGTSKSNLAKARKQLQQILFRQGWLKVTPI